MDNARLLLRLDPLTTSRRGCPTRTWRRSIEPGISRGYAALPAGMDPAGRESTEQVIAGQEPCRLDLFRGAPRNTGDQSLADGHRTSGANMLTRRSFLKLTGASTIALYVAAEAGWT